MILGLRRELSGASPPLGADIAPTPWLLMPNVIIFSIALLLLSASARAEVCLTEPEVTIDIVALHDPPTLHSEFSLQQLRDIAQSTHRGGKHEPLGYYFGKFGYTIDMRFAPAGLDCPETIAITLTMGLFDRQIEVAGDLPEGRCLYRTALLHYRRHAQADDDVFSRYARRVTLALHAAPTRQIGGPNPSPADIDKIKLNIESIVEKALSSFNDDRDAAETAVDTPAEVDRLAHACALTLILGAAHGLTPPTREGSATRACGSTGFARAVIAARAAHFGRLSRGDGPRLQDRSRNMSQALSTAHARR